jgi:ABC-type Fe3+/spermidine/putrescine transport system ATPase subunit
MSEPFLQLRDLCKRFGKIEALRSVSLELGEDELLVVLGPTGAGKTTLLRTLAGLESPDGGEMRLQGRDLAPLSPAERGVAGVCPKI